MQFLGKSATEVTGSINLVTTPTGEKILLDCGLYQHPNPHTSHQINTKKFDFKPSELTAVIISHLNIDHLGLVPRLFAEGATCKVYMYHPNLEFVPIMLKDSAKIMDREAFGLSRRHGTNVNPIYTQKDVDNSIQYFLGCDKNTLIPITDNVDVEFTPAGHIFGSTQITLHIKTPSGRTSKISYSGDIGNTIFNQPFVEPFEPIENCDLYIGECTYNNPSRSYKLDQRDKDLELMETVVRQTVENKGHVLIPVFALQRMETMLYTLWSIFHKDTSFKTQIVVDSPLAVKILDEFENTLKGDDYELLQKILDWKNIRIVRDVEESKAVMTDGVPKVICSSSGMLTQGRSILYLKKILPCDKSAILTCGYMAEGGLGWKIKNVSHLKTITIDNKPYLNKCNIYSLKSYSSHMQYEQLLSYYTDLAKNGCQTICLVHGDGGKIEFKKALEKRIRKINKTTKVVAVNATTTSRL